MGWTGPSNHPHPRTSGFACLLILTDEEAESQIGKMTCLRSPSLGFQISKAFHLAWIWDSTWAFHAVWISRRGACKGLAGEQRHFSWETPEQIPVTLLQEVIQNAYMPACETTGSPLCPQPPELLPGLVTARDHSAQLHVGHCELAAPFWTHLFPSA